MSEQLVEPRQETLYDSIIPTGWLTAYCRTFTDIPYSEAMFAELEATHEARGETDTLAEMKDTKLALRFEARYKLLGSLIAQTGIKQVLEIASGLSTRGLEFTADDTVQYVEVDLPNMAADKRAIVANLQRGGEVPERPNLHFESGNAVDMHDLLAATRHFDSAQPVAVVNEGLLRYLSFDDKAAYADNVRTLLRKFGGAWITSDISFPPVVSEQNGGVANLQKSINGLTGIDVGGNHFKDEAEATLFFEALGFDAESYDFSAEAIDGLSSAARLGMPRDRVKAINGASVCFVMRLQAEDRTASISG